MTHPIIKTDKYILITSDEEIKIEDTTINLKSTHNHKELCTIDNDIELERYAKKQGNDCKKVIAHLPLNNSPMLEGVPLLPQLPNEEDDVEKLVNNYVQELVECKSVKESERTWISAICHQSITKAKEKYKFTEEDMVKAFEYGKTLKGYDWIGDLIESLSQPKLPVGFKCEMERIEVNYRNGFLINTMSQPKIINGVMQGEWIFE